MTKKAHIILIFLCLVAMTHQAHAAKLNGEAYGKFLGSMSFEVAPGVSIGEPESNDCDPNTNFCVLKGVSWSDAIGWTMWTGSEIKEAVENQGGIFLEDRFAKTGPNGNFGGFLWGDTTGWMSLSACDLIETQNECLNKNYCQWSDSETCGINALERPPQPQDQTGEDWGAYIDLCHLKKDQNSCESQVSDPFCNWDQNSCLFDEENNPQGEPLRGYAWSEHLGWIKFGPEAGDAFPGVFVDWNADETAPEVYPALENAWIMNDSPTGTIRWLEFGSEKESSIDTLKSDVDYSLNQDPGYLGCNKQLNESALITQEDDKVNIDFPLIGLIDATIPHAHCKYELNGVIYNESGYGYFFGAEAEKRAQEAGVDLMKPDPHIIDSNLRYLFTMAGQIDPKNSAIDIENEAMADGLDSLESQFSPKDLAGNPLLNIPFNLEGQKVGPENAVRNVSLGYHWDGTSYLFDSVNPENNLKYNYPAPLSVEGQLYSAPGLLSYPKDGPNQNHVVKNGSYLLTIKGYAPTNEKNALILESIDFHTNAQGQSSLPSLSPSMPEVPLKNEVTLNEQNDFASLPHFYNIKPALELTSGELNAETITLGQDLLANFEFKNQSKDLNLNQYAIDHIFEFKDLQGNANEDVLEIVNLSIEPSSDKTLSRTDRKAQTTRYQLLFDELQANNLANNPFHTNKTQHHEPFYEIDFDADGIDQNGEYQVDGKDYAQPNDLEPYPETTIDRSDLFEVGKIESQMTTNYTLTLRPSQFVGQAPDSNITFNIHQYVAYKTNSDLSQFTIYNAPSFIEGLKVKTVGLGTSGVVGGEQILEPISNRDLEKVTLTSSADLRKEMRRNVTQLIRNINSKNCSGGLSLNELPTTPSECIIVNEKEKTIVAIFNEETLTLENENGVINVPDGYRYTLILLNGANLYLKSNLKYSNESSSLGIIAMQSSQGDGGNVYIDPQPTNLVGLLYAEGSILSSPDGGKTFYYGNGENAPELKNQLLWQGSIASRNTIGGAASNLHPEGVNCEFWQDNLASCAKAFDLDFIRRFNLEYNQTEQVYHSNFEAYFSGGGSCQNSQPIKCNLGGLPTTVMVNGNNTIDIENSKSLDTFFIERDNRPVPLGFTQFNKFTNQQTIR